MGRTVRTEIDERERKFVEAYMATANGPKAAKAAGYKGNAKALANRARVLLRRARVKEALAARAKEDPLVATREERQRFWTRVMNGEPMEQPMGEAGVLKVPPAIRDRLAAAKLLGHSQGDFIERHEHKHVAEVTIVMPDNSRE